MPVTGLRGRQILDGDVTRADVNTSTSGSALITKLIAGTNITITSTGVDAGTGDVTINATGGSSLNGTGFVRMSGTTASYITGTSSQFVKADGSLDSSSYYLSSGGILTGNPIIHPGSNASYGAGVKFRNEGYAHYSIGVKGSNLVIGNTGSDGQSVWPAGTVDLITITTAGNLVTIGTITATSVIRSGGTSSQFLKADGSVDSSTYLTGNQTITLSGDATGSGTTAITVTLANSGVTAGTYNNVTVNAKGIVTSGSNVSYLTSYTETDTLATVTGRGASTSSNLTVNATLTLTKLIAGGAGNSTLNTIGGNIGSTTPSWNNAQLELRNSDAGTVAIAFHRAGYTSNTIDARDGNGIRIDGNIAWHQGNLTNLSQLTNGPGYITPNSTVSGWIAFQASTQGTTIIRAVQQDTTSGYYLFQGITGSTEVFRVDRSGNMTIAGTLTEQSAARYKENISPLTAALDKVDQLKPVSYNKKGSTTKEIGLIAEDVFDVFPEFVLCDDNGEPVGIHYSRLTAILIESVKELKEEINELKNRN